MKTRIIELNDRDDSIKIVDKDSDTGLSESYVTTPDSLAKMFGSNFHLGWMEASHDGIVYFTCTGGKWDFVVQLAGQQEFIVKTGANREGTPMRLPWIYHVIRLAQDNLSGGFRREGECLMIAPNRILSLNMPVYSAYSFFPHVNDGQNLGYSNICWGHAPPSTMIPSNLVNVTRSFVNTTFLSGHYTNFTKWKEYTDTGIFPTTLKSVKLDQLLKGSAV